MKILFCNNDDCKDVLRLREGIVITCACKLTSGKLIDDIAHINGSFAQTMDIPEENFFSLASYFADNTCIKSVSTSQELINQNKQFCVDVINYLNSQAGTTYKTKFPSAFTTLILERKRETGCTQEDFYTVIDKKVKQWKGTEYENYLIPSTLFAKKHFINYLGQLSHAKGNTSTLGDFSDAVRAAKR